MLDIKEKLKHCKATETNGNAIFIPEFFRLSKPDERRLFLQLLNTPGIVVYDYLFGTLMELIKTNTPSKKFTSAELEQGALEHIAPLSLEEYGVWVYYPWSNKLVHILDEAEFIEVRTSRNQYKITREERDILSKKTIGVIGLSVGQSVSLTLCMERICGEIRLADFDTLELTNLNRIRTGLHNLGLPKVCAVAREIAEMDPFISIKCFEDGIVESNMDDFFTKDGKLDLLIEESDGFDIKILSRHKARELGIPVIMETSDRCMVDVERFDLEPQRPILHGLAANLDVEVLKTLKTNEQKIPYMLDILGIDTMSVKLKASMMEIEQTITTWPQLASSVTMGGGITADVSRRLLLGTYTESGRYHVDIEELIGDKIPENSDPKFGSQNELGLKELNAEMMESAVNKITERFVNKNISAELITKMTMDAIQAPSGGNNQPWKWYANNGELFLFHDKIKSAGWSDPFDNIARISLGTAIENLRLSALQNKFDIKLKYYPVNDEPLLVAQFSFTDSVTGISEQELNQYNTIYLRCTNRKLGENIPISKLVLNDISKSAGQGNEVVFTEDIEEIREISEIVSTVEKIRFMHPLGYREFFEKELKWEEKPEDGLDIATLEMSNSEKAAMRVVSNSKVIDKIREWDGGNGFKKISGDTIKISSAIGLLRLDKNTDNIYLKGGEALQRVWLTANHNGISFHPISAPLFFFDWIKKKNDLPRDMILELKELEKRFFKVFKENESKTNMFLFRLVIAEPPTERSLRRDITKMLVIN